MKATILLVLALALSPLLAPSAFAQNDQKSTPAGLVDALNGVFGKQTDNRAVHAKGIVLEGKFTPSPEAAALSKAPHLQGTAVPVTVRFSDFAGVPAIPDSETHPIAKTFLTAEKPAPVSFGTLPYFGVNSFKFTDAKGDVTYVRYRLEPEAGAQYLTKDQLAAAGPNYLVEEIGKRVGDGPVRFKYIAQVAEEGDKIDDPSIAWPDSRKTVELGVIEIDKVDADSATAERALIFQPTAVPAGIEPADPMISARSAAYAVSFGRRHATAPQ
jgi:catalase